MQFLSKPDGGSLNVHVNSGPPPFPTDGDMLDYLVQTGKISEPDGLFATWFHRANSKEEMNAALASTLTDTLLGWLDYSAQNIYEFHFKSRQYRGTEKTLCVSECTLLLR